MFSKFLVVGLLGITLNTMNWEGLVVDKSDMTLELGIADDEDTAQSVFDKYKGYDYAISLGNLNEACSVDTDWVTTETPKTDILMLDKNSDIHIIPANTDLSNLDLTTSSFTLSGGITCVSDSMFSNVNQTISSGIALADTKDKFAIKFYDKAVEVNQIKYDCETALGDYADNIYIIPCDLGVFDGDNYVLGEDNRTEAVLLEKH